MQLARTSYARIHTKAEARAAGRSPSGAAAARARFLRVHLFRSGSWQRSIAGRRHRPRLEGRRSASVTDAGHRGRSSSDSRSRLESFSSSQLLESSNLHDRRRACLQNTGRERGTAVGGRHSLGIARARSRPLSPNRITTTWNALKPLYSVPFRCRAPCVLFIHGPQRHQREGYIYRTASGRNSSVR